MKKLTTEEFIIKAKSIHGDKYDYSITNYVNSYSKIKITCPEHENFEQTPNSHLNGSGCYKCGVENRSEKQRMVNEDFICKANLVYGDKYDYSLVEYFNNKTKIKIICSKHGVFEIKPNDHLNGSGCGRCFGRGKTTEDFITEAISKYGLLYSYKLTEYKSTHKKIKIICSIHGMFEKSPNHHLNGGGCPICKESKGESEIRKYLTENNINFLPQHRFPDCRDIRPLPFDFYLPDYNTCIEYQGEQHYKPINYFGGFKVFKQQQKRDRIKLNYCVDKQIDLIIIKYDEKITNKLKQYYAC
jgi:hypothetical protein